MVLIETMASIYNLIGRLSPNWQGPYVSVQNPPTRGAVKPMDIDREEYTKYTNLDQLKSTMHELQILHANTCERPKTSLQKGKNKGEGAHQHSWLIQIMAQPT